MLFQFYNSTRLKSNNKSNQLAIVFSFLVIIFINCLALNDAQLLETSTNKVDIDSNSIYYPNNNPLFNENDNLVRDEEERGGDSAAPADYDDDNNSYDNNNNIDENYYNTGCYDHRTRMPKKCMPEFINAAFELKVVASNTCGERFENEYCEQTNLHNSFKSNSAYSSYYNDTDASNADSFYRSHSRCQKCDPILHHADKLTDHNDPNNITWWQSETMLEGVQYPNSVNLTLNLGKSFDINYIQIKFHSSRPESFAIFKRTYENGPWVPYQFYSASCRETYNVPLNQIIMPGNEAVAVCTDEFSDIAPLTGASVVFGTLEDRPSAYNFENSEELKEWVTASDIRISLNRLNTFGDEVFNDPQVLKSYFYAISDIAVGGRCKCNGHAKSCSVKPQHDFEDRLSCDCEHNTDGLDCEKCLPFFNDVPWAPATELDAHECKACSCNGLSMRCEFNQTLYDLTGHGGYCLDCEGNTEGAHCEFCKIGFYRRENDVRCIDCQCNPIGSESIQCDPFGRCKCKPGVTGDKCDRCAPYHYELSIVGCKICNCNLVGSLDNPPICDPRDGSCRCKANVEGQNCDRPKPGFFNLDKEHVHGAMPCFCYSHSSICNSSSNYFVYNITAKYISQDKSSNSRWESIDSRNKKNDVSVANGEVISTIGAQQEDLYLLAPKDFLGNQLLSYNQDLSFVLRLASDTQAYGQILARPSRKDIILENAQYGLEAYIPIYGDSSSGSSTGKANQVPNLDSQTYVFRLSQYSGWMPSLSTSDFQRLLTNLSAIKIRVSYAPQTRAILSKLTLGSAKHFSKKSYLDEIELDIYGQTIRKDLKTALFVEECKCPIGHIGQHCEQCAEGYRREPIEGGPFARCVPCNCNQHSLSCDQNTGKCDCLHHTNGDNCEKCEEGYYGNPIVKQLTSSDDPNGLHSVQLSENELANMCKKCPCLNDGPCAEIFNYQLNRVEIVCLACPKGTQGNLCELCDDGYFNKDPLSKSAASCEKCLCNGNIDENAIGNCDQQTGKCLKCVFNTTGDLCERCLPNHWGNALTSLKCHDCECFSYGTRKDMLTNKTKQCNLNDGKCDCLPNVKNRQCNECKNGYWNILSGQGCEECKCNPLGSFNLSCDSTTGQCYCRPGVQGLKCDSCMPFWYGFSDEGCKRCDCDPFGTEMGSMQCDDFGKCKCRENFSGLKCNKCEENFYNFTSGCLKCDQCYNLVQVKVNNLRDKIRIVQSSLNKLLAQSGSQSINDQTIELQKKLQNIKDKIDSFHYDLFDKNGLKSTYKDSVLNFKDEIKKMGESLKSIDQLFDQFNALFKQTERLYQQANNSIAQTKTQLNFMDRKNEEQAEKLESIREQRQNYDQNLKLQNFAKQAREVAEKQQEIAQNITDHLRDTVRDAQRSVKDLHDILIKYERLESDRSLDSILDNGEVIKSTANNLINEAQMQKNILNENIKHVNKFIEELKKFQMPDEKKTDAINQDVKVSLDKISSRTLLLKDEIDLIKSKFDSFSSNDLLASIGFAQTQLNNAKLKQRDIEYLFSLAERVRNDSDNANTLANQVFDNASRILETLEKFDDIVATGKDRIKEAESLKATTDNNLEQSREIMRNLQEQLNLLKNRINDIKFSTFNSETTIKEANYTFENLKQKVGELKKLTKVLEERSFNLTKNYKENTQPKADDAIVLQKSLSDRTDQILKQADEVANRTQKLLDDANNGFEGVNRINKSLTEFSVSNIKREDIARLQNKFDELMSQLDIDKQIDESIVNLEKNTKFLHDTTKQYRSQIDYLRKEIENLEVINNSLERKCFANTFAKPEL